MSSIQEVLNLMRSKAQELQKDYTTWICKNPSRAADIESSLKILSYLLHGKVKHANVLPELLYCSSNLLSFWHNKLISKEAELQIIANQEDLDSCQSPRVRRILKIQSTLTILEYFEVFLEVSAKVFWGELGKWLMILIIQSVKTGLRAALLFYYKVGLIPGPSAVGSTMPKQKNNVGNNNGGSDPKVVFVLKHSGRVVRKIHASPPIKYRNWKLPDVPRLAVFPKELPSLRLGAELLHILRPLSHLLGMAVYGPKSWKPWALSLVMDVSSLQLHSQIVQRLRPEQKQELSRRQFALLYYLIRSPFYDSYTKHRLMGLLVFMSKRIPLIGRLCAILVDSIPEWQDTYSYIWNDF
ncbi:unnamed protein product [Allacma fusca]|uniref:Peroxisomal membrane protein PEX16 n=1 Tax=Allacma fusca TaxID=39272 RepID=A0A8J2K479_9HEXA|nr:unnamed protein product [Allacma fusca]